MTILGWQLNIQSDANFLFVLGYQIVNFHILVVDPDILVVPVYMREKK
jgi:hypothetical protein